MTKPKTPKGHEDQNPVPSESKPKRLESFAFVFEPSIPVKPEGPQADITVPEGPEPVSADPAENISIPLAPEELREDTADPEDPQMVSADPADTVSATEEPEIPAEPLDFDFSSELWADVFSEEDTVPAAGSDSAERLRAAVRARHSREKVFLAAVLLRISCS